MVPSGGFSRAGACTDISTPERVRVCHWWSWRCLISAWSNRRNRGSR